MADVVRQTKRTPRNFIMNLGRVGRLLFCCRGDVDLCFRWVKELTFIRYVGGK